MERELPVGIAPLSLLRPLLGLTVSPRRLLEPRPDGPGELTEARRTYLKEVGHAVWVDAKIAVHEDVAEAAEPLLADRFGPLRTMVALGETLAGEPPLLVAVWTKFPVSGASTRDELGFSVSRPRIEAHATLDDLMREHDRGVVQ